MNRDKDIPLSSVEEFLQRKAAGTLTEKEQSMVDIFEVLGLRELGPEQEWLEDWRAAAAQQAAQMRQQQLQRWGLL